MDPLCLLHAHFSQFPEYDARPGAMLKRKRETIHTQSGVDSDEAQEDARKRHKLVDIEDGVELEGLADWNSRPDDIISDLVGMPGATPKSEDVSFLDETLESWREQIKKRAEIHKQEKKAKPGPSAGQAYEIPPMRNSKRMNEALKIMVYNATKSKEAKDISQRAKSNAITPEEAEYMETQEFKIYEKFIPRWIDGLGQEYSAKYRFDVLHPLRIQL